MTTLRCDPPLEALPPPVLSVSGPMAMAFIMEDLTPLPIK